MAKALGTPCPETEPHAQETWVFGTLLRSEQKTEAEARQNARAILALYPWKKSEFRGMLFDRRYINDNGLAVDASGHPLEDESFAPLPGKEIEPWPHYVGRNILTGETISGPEFDALPENQRKDFTKVRFFQLTDPAQARTQYVSFADTAFVSELLERDLAIGDPVNRRYLIAAGDSLRDYRSVITAAILKMQSHHSGLTPMMVTQVGAGHIANLGQFHLATLQGIATATRPMDVFLSDAATIRDWTQMLRAQIDDEIFRAYFPDEAITNYRSVNGHHLGGAKCEGTNWCSLLPQEVEAYDPETALSLRRDFVRHILLPRAARQLTLICNRTLTADTADRVKPGVLDALVTLIQALEELSPANLAAATVRNLFK